LRLPPRTSALKKSRIVGNIKNDEYQVNQFRGDEFLVSPTFPELKLTAEQIFQAGRSPEDN
jgi:Uma2 family endonuclease